MRRNRENPVIHALRQEKPWPHDKEYWFISDEGVVLSATFTDAVEWHKNRLGFKNCFRSEADAQFAQGIVAAGLERIHAKLSGDAA